MFREVWQALHHRSAWLSTVKVVFMSISSSGSLKTVVAYTQRHCPTTISACLLSDHREGLGWADFKGQLMTCHMRTKMKRKLQWWMVANLGYDNQTFQPQSCLDIQIPDQRKLVQESFHDCNSKFPICSTPLQLKLKRTTSVRHEYISIHIWPPSIKS